MPTSEVVKESDGAKPEAEAPGESDGAKLEEV